MNKMLLLYLLAGWLPEEGGKIVVPSCKIKQLRPHLDPSKQELKRKKGKKLRTNRGRNRGK